jgi:hypothetical protein
MTLASKAAAQTGVHTLPARPKAIAPRDPRYRSPDPVQTTGARRRPPSRRAAPVTAAQLLRATLLLFVGFGCSQMLHFDRARAASKPALAVAMNR